MPTEGRFTFSIIVGDNDVGESGRKVAADFSAATSVPVIYCVEPRQNIALVRNRVLSHLQGQFVAFIDDDEVPTDSWLLSLLTTCDATAAQGVLGPVLSTFTEDAPKWLTESGLYDFRKRHVTGTTLRWQECRTGNVLLRREVVEGLPGPFREEFRTGGEDQDFFRRAIEQGHKFVWCDEAIVHEVVQPSRYRRRVLLSRALLRGKDTFRHRSHRTRNLIKACVAVPIYSLLLPLYLVWGQQHFMRLATKLTAHLGLLLAAVGLNPSSVRRM